MLKTSILPFGISVLVYMYLSLKNPLLISGSAMVSEISRLFNIGWIVLLPAIIVILLALFKVDVKLAMGLSILVAIIIGVTLQHRTILEMLKFAIVGYSMNDTSFLRSVIHGGGVIPMLKASLIVVIASSYSGIFEGTGMLRNVETFIESVSNKWGCLQRLYSQVLLQPVLGAVRVLRLY
jgi:NhaC family Na+:H+ antiporter